ncbi:hypothetical protein D3C77_561360 [compost metagenome]
MPTQATTQAAHARAGRRRHRQGQLLVADHQHVVTAILERRQAGLGIQAAFDAQVAFDLQAKRRVGLEVAGQ